MRLLPAACLVLVACGGSPVPGTWRTTSTVTSAGGTSTVATDFIITATEWVVGGGCRAPLETKGSVALLSSANWTCSLQSNTGLPFVEVLQYQWQQGDVLLVKNARFEVVAMDKLKIDFALQIRTDPNDPGVGPVVESKSVDGKGAERVR